MPRFSAYGLTIESALPLPLPPAAAAGEPDLVFGAGPLGDADDYPVSFANWHAGPCCSMVDFPGIGRIRAADGTRLVYDCAAGLDPSRIASVVMGTGLAALLMQRGLVPVHASSVLTRHGALMVMGRSGVGKSTLLGGLRAHGLAMLADDVTALAADGHGEALAIPAFPASRLWEDALARLGEDAAPLTRVRDDVRKYYLPVERFHPDPVPVRWIIHLAVHNRPWPELVPVPAAERLPLLSRFIFRKRYVDAMGLRRAMFPVVARACDQAVMLRLNRPVEGCEPDDLARFALDALAELAPGEAPPAPARA